MMRSLKKLIELVIQDRDESAQQMLNAKNTTHQAYCSARAKYWRHIIKDGYPRPTPLSFEEAKEYCNNARSICLLCGWSGVRVCVHVGTHNITGEEYRRAYHLPLSLGLTPPAERKKLSDYAKKNRLSENFSGDKGEFGRAKSGKVRKERSADIGNGQYQIMAVKARKGHRVTEADFERIYEIMMINDLTYWEVKAKFGHIPSFKFPSLRAWLRNHTHRARYYEVLDRLSFQAQVRAQHMGPTFAASVDAALKQGIPKSVIARQLLVSRDVVNTYINRKAKESDGK